MNPKAELLKSLLVLFDAVDCDSEKLSSAIENILSEYRIERQPRQKSKALSSHVEAFLAAKKVEGLAITTLKNYRLYLFKFVASMDISTRNISTEDIREYVGNLQLSDSSLQTILATLRSFFGWLHREEIIKKNPMLKIPGRSASRNMRRALNLESLERLRQAADTKREKALVEFFFSTGCRISEVSSIQLPDVDFNQRCVRVLGKGGKERMVYFSIRAQLLLMDYLNSRKGNSTSLFTNIHSPFGPTSARSIQKVFKSIGQRAELSQCVHPHLLRHTFATISLNNGMDITVIQKLLGHTQLSTTQIYANISMANVRHEYERCIS